MFYVIFVLASIIQRGLVNQLKDDMERLYQQIQVQMVSINYLYSHQIPVVYARTVYFSKA